MMRRLIAHLEVKSGGEVRVPYHRSFFSSLLWRSRTVSQCSHGTFLKKERSCSNADSRVNPIGDTL